MCESSFFLLELEYSVQYLIDSQTPEVVVVVVVVVALSWVKAEPLYPHHNYILG